MAMSPHRTLTLLVVPSFFFLLVESSCVDCAWNDLTCIGEVAKLGAGECEIQGSNEEQATDLLLHTFTKGNTNQLFWNIAWRQPANGWPDGLTGFRVKIARIPSPNFNCSYFPLPNASNIMPVYFTQCLRLPDIENYTIEVATVSASSQNTPLSTSFYTVNVREWINDRPDIWETNIAVVVKENALSVTFDSPDYSMAFYWLKYKVFLRNSQQAEIESTVVRVRTVKPHHHTYNKPNPPPQLSYVEIQPVDEREYCGRGGGRCRVSRSARIHATDDNGSAIPPSPSKTTTTGQITAAVSATASSATPTTPATTSITSAPVRPPASVESSPSRIVPTPPKTTHSRDSTSSTPSVGRNLQPGGNQNTAKALGSVLGGLGIVAVAAILLFVYKRRSPHITWPCEKPPISGTPSPPTKPDDLQKNNTITTTRKVFILYSNDNVCHLNVVRAFAAFLHKNCYCDVIFDEWDADKVRQDRIDYLHQAIVTADKVIFIQSKGTFLKYEAIRSGDRYMERHNTPMGDMFYLAFQQAKHDMFEHKEKYILAYFNYSSPKCLIKNLPITHSYELMNHMEDLFMHIHDLVRHNQSMSIVRIENVSSNEYTLTNEGAKLKAAIDAAAQLNTNNPKWFEENFCLGNNNAKNENTDSGVDTLLEEKGVISQRTEIGTERCETPQGSDGVPEVYKHQYGVSVSLPTDMPEDDFLLPPSPGSKTGAPGTPPDQQPVGFVDKDKPIQNLLADNSSNRNTKTNIHTAPYSGPDFFDMKAKAIKGLIPPKRIDEEVAAKVSGSTCSQPFPLLSNIGSSPENQQIQYLLPRDYQNDVYIGNDNSSQFGAFLNGTEYIIVGPQFSTDSNNIPYAYTPVDCLGDSECQPNPPYCDSDRSSVSSLCHEMARVNEEFDMEQGLYGSCTDRRQDALPHVHNGGYVCHNYSDSA